MFKKNKLASTLKINLLSALPFYNLKNVSNSFKKIELLNFASNIRLHYWMLNE